MTREQEYADLVQAKRDLQADLANVQASIDQAERELLAEWEAAGITSMRVEDENGSRWLLYQSRRVFAKTEFVNLTEIPTELHMLSAQKCASQLSELLAAGDKEGLERLANLGIYPHEKIQIHVKKG